MAECSYARCLLERRLIKRELMKWSKDMLHIVGLERVAEELMGRRKWKHFQEVHTKSHMSTESNTAIIATTTTTTTTATKNITKENNNLKELNSNEQDRSNLNSIEDSNNSNCSNKEKSIDDDTLNLLKTKENPQQHMQQVKICKEEENEQKKEHHKESSHNNKNNNKNIEENQKATGELADNINNKIQIQSSLEPLIENNNNKGEPEESSAEDITATAADGKSERSAKPVESITQTAADEEEELNDWKPDEKCNFCINGKLLIVNEKGELVAESGPAMSETEAQRLDTDSDSDESSNIASGGGGGGGGRVGVGVVNNAVNNEVNDNRRLDLTKLLTSRQRDFPANMASINSLAPQLATIQSLSGQYFQNLNWLQLAQQTSQQLNSATTPTTSEISAAALSPSLKDSPSPSDATGEQPLDLSSKPSPNSSTCGDLKAVRPKSSRSTPLSTGRRTYSDEDLNNALQDVLSGKSGTRKAAVRYSVPRSTLRNKMQALQTPLQQMDVDNSDDDGGDDNEADADSTASTAHQQQSFDETFPVTLLKKLTENNGNLNSTLENANSATSKNANKTQNASAAAPLLAEALAQGTQPAALLQAIMLLASNFGGLDDRVSVRDLLSALLVGGGGGNSCGNANAGLKTPSDSNDVGNTENANLNNGRTANYIAQRLLLQQLQQQENQQHQRTSPFTTRLATSDTPETNSSFDPNDDEQSSILKIPSYKPVAGSSGTREPSVSPSSLVNNNNNNSLNSSLHRNGDSPQSAAPSPRIPTSLLAAAVGGSSLNTSCSRQSNIPVISPPLPSHQSLGSADSQSPPSICFRDMIANSIHRTMSDQANKEAVNSNDYKKPSISVVKNIGGTDTSRFGAAPNVLAVVGGSSNALHHNHQSQFHMQAHHQHHSTHHLSRAEAAALAAGKGTRPKRGKYRNYDRDSLVEAVKAVQRGEMSVHRAGSYYGVPHSTLEYKVKERHLMRPRKREPKPQPGLDGTSVSVASTSKSNSNIPGLQNSLDKMKSSGGVGANSNLKQLNNALKNNTNSALSYTSATANGMPPLFDPAAMAQLQYAPQFFWQHGPTAAFSQLQIDLNRNAAAAQSSVAHMQRLRDEQTMPGGGNSANSPSPATSPLSSQNHHHAFTPETLYEGGGGGGGTNGSFLDGIIRKTLDRKASIDLTPHSSTHNSAASHGSGALLDQLVNKKPLPFTNNRVNDFATNVAGAGVGVGATAFGSTVFSTAGGIKRASSPPAFPGIKRERATPPPLLPSASSDDEESTALLEHNNNNNKNNPNGNGRTNLGSDSEDTTSLRVGGHHTTSTLNTHSNHKSKTEDVNGGGGGGGVMGDAAAMPKTKPATSPAPLTESNAVASNVNAPTSILQEKLAQIKAEQEASEINL